MAFKTFTAGAVLTASDVNTYLAKQAVVVCTSTTRPSSPPEGMVIYETDTDLLLTYTGSAWVQIMPVTTTGVSTWTPTLTQSGTVSHTATEARYVRNGCVVEAWGFLAVTGSGTTNNNVTVTLPVTASGNATGSVIGESLFVVSSVAYVGVAQLVSSTTISFRTAPGNAAASLGGNGSFGVNPNVGLASGDSVRFHIRYTV